MIDQLGKYLSIIWSDGLTELLESGRGKVIQTSRLALLDPIGNKPRSVTLHECSTNLIETPLEDQVERESEEELVDDWVSLSLDDEPTPRAKKRSPIPTKDEANYEHLGDFLPRHLALIDVERELPRLSALPRTEARIQLDLPSPRAFTTQAAVDEAFDSQAENSNAVDIVIRGWNTSQTSLAIPNLFCESLPTSSPLAEQMLIAHASNPRSQSHILLTQEFSSFSKDFNLFTLQLEPVNASKHDFKLICQYSSHLQDVGSYILQTITAIRNGYRTATDTPNRFIESAREALQEDLSGDTANEEKLDLDAAFCQTALTGSIPRSLVGWLIDTLQDRNLKRWDQAVTSGLGGIVRLTHTALLPALERASVIASRLRGLARTSPQIPIFQIDEKKLTRVLNDLDILRLIAHHLLRYASEELRGFQIFSAWLTHNLAIASADSSEPSAIDAAEKAAALDQSTLLSYITGPLLKSHLTYFLMREAGEITGAPRTSTMQLRWDFLVRVLDGHRRKPIQPKPGKEGMTGGRVEVSNLLWQGFMAADGIKEVAKVPRENVMKGLKIEQLISLELTADGRSITILAMRMIEHGKNHQTAIILSTRGSSPDSLQLTVVEIISANGFHTAKQYQTRSLVLSQRSHVLAARFLDDDNLLVLSRESPRSFSFGACRLVYNIHAPEQAHMIVVRNVLRKLHDFEIDDRSFDCRYDDKHIAISAGHDHKDDTQERLQHVVVAVMDRAGKRFQLVR